MRLINLTGVPYQIRTRVTAVKGRCPGPLDERDSLRHGTNIRAGGGVADPPVPVKRSRRHLTAHAPTGPASQPQHDASSRRQQAFLLEHLEPPSKHQLRIHDFVEPGLSNLDG